ncbi:hypothetical protein [Streptomyces sparsogenes]|uniref:Uncharacterized protein n=1 Tax=Streptomyces sparsogenes DSM 40356 TaxID=1331668 RepID=A0A1R1SNT3_9ACTN|nr:hypothetical protein [Streptomyces sparsogenes]OMI39659.1 hypothetical protein SPAR_09808 [Streptomyces sparsogenes DSM 40356]
MTSTDPAGASPPAWAVQHTLCLPSEDAARQAASELAAFGHRLVAVRAHDHFRSDPSSFWYGKPSLDPELTGWWQVFSLAVHTGHERLALEPFLRGERIRIAGVARSHGGFHQGCAEGHATTLQQVFSREGLVHEHPTAEVPPPAPLPTDPAPPDRGPRWTGLASGGPDDGPEDVVRAVVAVAERRYGSAEDAPDSVGWLLEEDFAFGEPYETTGAFLGDLADAVAHQGTCTDDTVEAVPFLAELAGDGGLPARVRVIVLCDLLRLAATGPSLAASAADRIAALGGAWQEPAAVHMTRRAIGRALPRLLTRGEEESDAARFVLAALTAAVSEDIPADLAASAWGDALADLAAAASGPPAGATTALPTTAPADAAATLATTAPPEAPPALPTTTPASALTTLAPHLADRLNDLPAPAGSPRADALALISALLHDDETRLATALSRLTSWRPALAERTATPHAAPRQVALAVLPNLVMEDVGPALHP